jgi:hypothetical protein
MDDFRINHHQPSSSCVIYGLWSSLFASFVRHQRPGLNDTAMTLSRTTQESLPKTIPAWQFCHPQDDHSNGDFNGCYMHVFAIS